MKKKIHNNICMSTEEILKSFHHPIICIIMFGMFKGTVQFISSDPPLEKLQNLTELHYSKSSV